MTPRWLKGSTVETGEGETNEDRPWSQPLRLVLVWLAANYGYHAAFYLLTGQPYFALAPLQAMLAELGLMALNLGLPLIALAAALPRPASLRSALAWRWRGWRTVGWGLLGFGLDRTLGAARQLAGWHTALCLRQRLRADHFCAGLDTGARTAGAAPHPLACLDAGRGDHVSRLSAEWVQPAFWAARRPPGRGTAVYAAAHTGRSVLGLGRAASAMGQPSAAIGDCGAGVGWGSVSFGIHDRRVDRASRALAGRGVSTYTMSREEHGYSAWRGIKKVIKRNAEVTTGALIGVILTRLSFLI